MRSGVRLAPMIPAIRATASASPFGTPLPRSSSITSGVVTTRPDATAKRELTGLAETSTMRAAPVSSTWESRDSSGIPGVYRTFDEDSVRFAGQLGPQFVCGLFGYTWAINMQLSDPARVW